MKIIIISHTFQLRYYYRRWELFAQQHPDVDVVLLAPEKFTFHRNRLYSYGSSETGEGTTIDEGNFHIRTFRMRSIKGMWVSPDFKRIFKEENPDLIYHLGTQHQISLVQIGKIVKRLRLHAKIALFSMRGPVSDLENMRRTRSYGFIEWAARYYVAKYVTKYVNKHYDAVFCHYPDAVASFRKEGFDGPIYMQTQVGVNTEWFYPNEEWGREIRERYNVGDAYLFGSASRFTLDKGIDDVIEALPKEGNWKYLMMGTGSESDIKRLKDKIHERGFEDRIIMPGFIDRLEMPKYWNAVDCAIHVPHTTPHWVETFSLSAIQPMATKKPIIANTSGSVPYQVGPDALVVAEGDIQQLHDRICWVLEHQEEAKAIGEKLYNRAISCFSVEHLNQMFYDTLQDVLKDRYDEAKVDMATYKTLEQR